MLNFQDSGFVLARRPYGETSTILSVFTQNHGRCLGFCRLKTPLDIGTFVHLKWHARIAEQLGYFTCEVVHCIGARYLEDCERLSCLSCLCALLDETLPERESLSDFFFFVNDFLNSLDDADWLKKYIQLEAKLLSILGFGMDLTKCAGGGNKQNLAYVSPKTARAVSEEKGNPYREKLLPLPAFLYKDAPANSLDLSKGLSLTGFFLARHVKKMPSLRKLLMP